MKFDWNIFMAAIATWIVARSKERSSYLGLITLASSLGIAISPELAQMIMIGGGLLAGSILLATKDKATVAIIQVTEAKPASPETLPPAPTKQILMG